MAEIESYRFEFDPNETLQALALWDWWAVIIMVFTVLVGITLYKARGAQTALPTLLLTVLILVITLADIYTTPMEFLTFWVIE